MQTISQSSLQKSYNIIIPVLQKMRYRDVKWLGNKRQNQE